MRTVLGFSAIVWGALILRLGIRRPERGSSDFFRYRRAWNARVAARFGFRLAVFGPMPEAGTLIVSNHQGFADINLLCAVLPAACKANFISKIEIGRLPIFGWHMEHYGDIIFDRQAADARRAALTAALDRLERGFSVVLFPEGTRSGDGKPKLEIRPALIDAAREGGFPIQPLAIAGTKNAMEKRWQRPWVTTITACFGESKRDWQSAEAVWNEVKRLHVEAAGIGTTGTRATGIRATDTKNKK